MTEVEVYDPAREPQVVSVTPDPLTLSPSQVVPMFVGLDIPARAGGEAITITPSLGSVNPMNVTVLEDMLSVGFDFTAPATPDTGTITADHDDNPSTAFASFEVILGSGLVINEVDYDQPGGDTTEFVEIFNNTGSSISLDGLKLVFINGASTVLAQYEEVDLTSMIELGGGEYLVVGSAAALALVPNGVPTIQFDEAIQNGDPDAVGLFDTNTMELVDALSYDGSVTTGDITGFGAYNFVEGTVASANDPGVGSMSRVPNGSDTDDADTDWVNAMPTPGSENMP